MTNNTDTLVELAKKTANDWKNWIEDILEHNVGYPISNLSPDGDVLKEMYFFIGKTYNSVAAYEKGLIKVLVESVEARNNTENIIRLLDVAIITKSSRFKDIYFNLFFDRNNFLLGDNSFQNTLVSKTLQGLSRISLNEDESSEIIETAKLIWLNKNINNPVFIGNYLRFIRIKTTPVIFFTSLSFLLEKQNVELENNPSLTKKNLIVIVDKIKELHFYNPPSFYSSILNWFCKDFVRLKKIAFFNELAKSFDLMLEETPFINELQTTDSRQALYGVSFRFIIHILVNEEKLGEYPLKTWLLLISTFLENHEELFLKNLLIEKSKVIVNNLCMYASTFLMHPTRNELIPLDSVKMHIVEFIDEIISSSYINDLRSQNGSRQSYLLNN